MSVLITGCSSGIGYHLAKRLKESGFDVIATCRQRHDVKRLEIDGFKCIALDVNDSKSIQDAVAIAISKSEQGQITALVNNAGFVQAGAVEDLSRESLQRQFETNVFGACELTNVLIPKMRTAKTGRIINISSILGVFPLAFTGAYNASKYALEGLTKTLQLELQDSPIKVSLVQPGPIHSSIRDNCIDNTLNAIDLEASVFKERYQSMLSSYKSKKNESFFTEGPEAVFKKVHHALTSKRPKKNYPVTLPTHILFFLKRVMPASSFDWILTKISDSNV